MPRSNIAPTRSNLLRIRQQLGFARQSRDILDRKREVLAKELVRLAGDAETIQTETEKLTAEAYRALAQAKLTMGQERVEWAALSVHKTQEVQVKYRGVMGIELPMIEASGEPPEITYSLGDTVSSLDEASVSFREVLSRIPELCRLVTSVWRLAIELRKTQRRVNALQYVFIPDYEETITFIQSSLEEREREEIFRLKLLETRSEKKG